MPDDLTHPEEPVDLSHTYHRQLIGYLGLLLPVLLLLLAAIRPTEGVPSNPSAIGSISAYYYTGGVAVFVGVLFALSLFLLSYRGYSDSVADRVLGFLGCLCAICVALFPTFPPEGAVPPSWWSEVAGTIHYVAAVSLFLIFILFALWLFRKSQDPTRNRVYLVCGFVMIAAIAWAGVNGATGHSIFWQEVIALWAFAISWLTKGQAHHSLANVARRVAGREAPTPP
jgi:hypothetical protein